MQRIIFDAASNGELHIIKCTFEKKTREECIQLVSTITDGATPLIAACWDKGSYDVAEYLIKSCGANVEQTGSVTVDEKTIEGVTPLWCAAARGHLNITKLLIKNHANVNSTTKTNSTPLRAACFGDHLEIVKFLIKSGADMEVANTRGHTCLMKSCSKRYWRTAQCLIDNGADVRRQDVNGNTAMHECARSGAFYIMDLLSAKGALSHVANAIGITPLIAAAAAGQAGIVLHLAVGRCLKEKIDAWELVGAALVNQYRMDEAHGYWTKALELRYQNDKLMYPKPQNASRVYGRREVDTFADLDKLSADPDEMRIQSRMIQARILGPFRPDIS